MKLINVLVLSFLLDSPHPRYDSLFIKGLNNDKTKIAEEIYLKNSINKNQEISFESYINNEDYFIKTLDINKDRLPDKIVSSKPYKGEDLYIFLATHKNKYNLSFKGYNFNEDGGNIIDNITALSNPNEKGMEIKTYFPGSGSYEKQYYILLKDKKWILQNIIYKTTSDNSKDAVNYICDVTQNLDMTKSGWMNKIKEIPNEDERNKKCKVEAIVVKSKSRYIINDPDGYTNLRKEKNSNSKILAKIKSGEEIDVLDKTSDWFLVKTGENQTGYVHKSRIIVE